MGQYYKPIFLGKDENGKDKILGYLSCYDYDNGAKLMEHSYIGNNFVGAVQALLERGVGKFAGSRLVWAGDYADEEPGKKKENLYELSEGKLIRKWVKPAFLRYAINETKKLYIDLRAIRGEWAIHPIPLLCSEGNGRGGGDYYEQEDNPDDEAVGTWARDVITFSNDRPREKGWKKVSFNFKEN